jgi:hypothetical protein
MQFSRLRIPKYIRGDHEDHGLVGGVSDGGNPLVFPPYLDTMLTWQRERYNDYEDKKSRGEIAPFNWEEPDPSSDEHWYWEQARDLHNRYIDEATYTWLKDNLTEHGVHVTLRMEPLPESPFFYTKKPEYWDRETGTKYEARLLQIHIEKGSKFVEFSGRQFTREDAPFDYHISLCFTNELHRFDLLHSERGVELGQAAYNRLREKYDGKEVLLKGEIHNYAFNILPGSQIQGGVEDFLIDDDFIMLHNAGAYADRPHHLSM